MDTTPTEVLQKAMRATRSQFLALGLFFGVWGVHVPTVKRVFALSEAQLSWVLLSAALGAVLALLVAGRVVGWLGPPRTARITAVVAGVLLSALLHWPHLSLLLLAMVVFGAASSLCDVAINTEGSALEQVGGQPVMGQLHGFFSVGGMLGALWAGTMIRLGWPAPVQLVIAGVGTALLAVLTGHGMVTAAAQHVAQPTPPGTTRFKWPPKVLLLLGLLALAGMAAEGALYDWGVLYLHQELSWPQARAAWGYAAFTGAMAAARFGGDRLRQRYGEPLVLKGGALLASGAMALLLWVAHPGLALIGFACVGVGLAMVVPILYNAAAGVEGTQRASAIATVSALGYAGFLVGPPLIGFLAEKFSLTWGLAAVVPLTLVLSWGARYTRGRT